MAVWADDGAGFNHPGHPSLGCAVDALEGPREECLLVSGRTPSSKGQGAEKVEGGRAEAAADFYAKGEKGIVLGCGSSEPAAVF